MVSSGLAARCLVSPGGRKENSDLWKSCKKNRRSPQFTGEVKCCSTTHTSFRIYRPFLSFASGLLGKILGLNQRKTAF